MRRKYDHDKILALVNSGLADWRIAEIMKMQKDRVGIIRRRYNLHHSERRTFSINIPPRLWHKLAFDRNYDEAVEHILEILAGFARMINVKSPDST